MGDAKGEDHALASDTLMPGAPSFAGMWRYLKGRLGRPRPPRHDAAKTLVQFQPCYRVKEWDGSPDDHRTAECVSVPACSSPGKYGRHSEVVPDGFNWEGVHFHSLFEAQENQAFHQWYELDGEEVLKRGKMVVRPALYGTRESLPLPRFNFFLHENIDKMTAQEILAYNRTGEIPSRLRRRGRNKPKPEALEE